MPNQGAIRFYDRQSTSIVKLTVSYAIPGIIGKIMDNLFLGRAVESTIQADLERFREYALNIQKWIYGKSITKTETAISASAIHQNETQHLAVFIPQPNLRISRFLALTEA